eukprot:gnl/Chilomastix_cuspidata/3180.p1 GENE.gnl/Chilomastix_cuspidata/3180~~gnl/Chilomastix_cuspidata/3180.p1  ORF type:complete len:1591 (+),score=728.19 gnl/Chilomastix_cuspidata/3180:97-4773(+)
MPDLQLEFALHEIAPLPALADGKSPIFFTVLHFLGEDYPLLPSSLDSVAVFYDPFDGDAEEPPPQIITNLSSTPLTHTLSFASTQEFMSLALNASASCDLFAIMPKSGIRRPKTKRKAKGAPQGVAVGIDMKAVHLASCTFPHPFSGTTPAPPPQVEATVEMTWTDSIDAIAAEYELQMPEAPPSMRASLALRADALEGLSADARVLELRVANVMIPGAHLGPADLSYSLSVSLPTSHAPVAIITNGERREIEDLPDDQRLVFPEHSQERMTVAALRIAEAEASGQVAVVFPETVSEPRGFAAIRAPRRADADVDASFEKIQRLLGGRYPTTLPYGRHVAPPATRPSSRGGEPSARKSKQQAGAAGADTGQQQLPEAQRCWELVSGQLVGLLADAEREIPTDDGQTEVLTIKFSVAPAATLVASLAASFDVTHVVRNATRRVFLHPREVKALRAGLLETHAASWLNLCPGFTDFSAAHGEDMDKILLRCTLEVSLFDLPASSFSAGKGPTSTKGKRPASPGAASDFFGSPPLAEFLPAAVPRSHTLSAPDAIIWSQCVTAVPLTFLRLPGAASSGETPARSMLLMPDYQHEEIRRKKAENEEALEQSFMDSRGGRTRTASRGSRQGKRSKSQVVSTEVPKNFFVEARAYLKLSLELSAPLVAPSDENLRRHFRATDASVEKYKGGELGVQEALEEIDQALKIFPPPSPILTRPALALLQLSSAVYDIRKRASQKPDNLWTVAEANHHSIGSGPSSRGGNEFDERIAAMTNLALAELSAEFSTKSAAHRAICDSVQLGLSGEPIKWESPLNAARILGLIPDEGLFQGIGELLQTARSLNRRASAMLDTIRLGKVCVGGALSVWDHSHAKSAFTGRRAWDEAQPEEPELLKTARAASSLFKTALKSVRGCSPPGCITDDIAVSAAGILLCSLIIVSHAQQEEAEVEIQNAVFLSLDLLTLYKCAKHMKADLTLLTSTPLPSAALMSVALVAGYAGIGLEAQANQIMDVVTEFNGPDLHARDMAPAEVLRCLSNVPHAIQTAFFFSPFLEWTTRGLLREVVRDNAGSTVAWEIAHMLSPEFPRVDQTYGVLGKRVTLILSLIEVLSDLCPSQILLHLAEDHVQMLKEPVHAVKEAPSAAPVSVQEQKAKGAQAPQPVFLADRMSCSLTPLSRSVQLAYALFRFRLALLKARFEVAHGSPHEARRVLDEIAKNRFVAKLKETSSSFFALLGRTKVLLGDAVQGAMDLVFALRIATGTTSDRRARLHTRRGAKRLLTGAVAFNIAHHDPFIGLHVVSALQTLIPIQTVLRVPGCVFSAETKQVPNFAEFSESLSLVAERAPRAALDIRNPKAILVASTGTLSALEASALCNEDIVDLWAIVGKSLLLQGHLAEAATALEWGLRLDPSRTLFHLRLALVRGVQGQCEGAIREVALAFEKGVVIDDVPADELVTLVQCLSSFGERFRHDATHFAAGLLSLLSARLRFPALPSSLSPARGPATLSEWYVARVSASIFENLGLQDRAIEKLREALGAICSQGLSAKEDIAQERVFLKRLLKQKGVAV